MLRIYIHSGHLDTRNAGNVMAIVDITYKKQNAWSDYQVVLSVKGVGMAAQDEVLSYPRWAGSLWDLVARALTRCLYRDDQAPEPLEPDRRCAYATRLCAVIEKSTADARSIELGTCELSQVGKQRGVYTAVFKEDILGERTASFTYGLKSLDVCDLMLRAICWAYFDKAVLGERPPLCIPASFELEKLDIFDSGILTEPARTGFRRYLGTNIPAAKAPGNMVKMTDYINFLERG